MHDANQISHKPRRQPTCTQGFHLRSAESLVRGFFGDSLWTIARMPGNARIVRLPADGNISNLAVHVKILPWRDQPYCATTC